MRYKNWVASFLGWCVFAIFACGSLSLTSLMFSPQPAFAQDGEADGAADGDADGAADGAADGDADGAADGDADGAADGGEDGGDYSASGDGDEEDDKEKKKKKKNLLGWMIDSLGAGYSITFLSLSFSLVALLVMNILQARRDNVVPVALVEGFENHLNEKRYQEGYEMAKNDSSFLGLTLSAGLAKLKEGYPQALEAMQEVGEEENMKLQHRLGYMALIGTISPMVGLFGTVHGMIDSFSVIADSTTTPPASELAEGISKALFTTLVGLFIAIPAIAVYNILRNRVDRLVLEVGIISEGLMGRFQNVGKKDE